MAQTVGPVSIALGVQQSQVMILTSQSTGRRRVAESWALRFGIFCEDEEEKTYVLDLLVDDNIISLMEGYMETLFDTLISIDGNGGSSFETGATFGSSSESDENLTLYYILFGNIAMIFVCCCLLLCCGGYAYHRYQRMKLEQIAVDVHRSVPFTERMSSVPSHGRFLSTASAESTSVDAAPSNAYPQYNRPRKNTDVYLGNLITRENNGRVIAHGNNELFITPSPSPERRPLPHNNEHLDFVELQSQRSFTPEGERHDRPGVSLPNGSHRTLSADMAWKKERLTPSGTPGDDKLRDSIRLGDAEAKWNFDRKEKSELKPEVGEPQRTPGEVTYVNVQKRGSKSPKTPSVVLMAPYSNSELPTTYDAISEQDQSESDSGCTSSEPSFSSN